MQEVVFVMVYLDGEWREACLRRDAFHAAYASTEVISLDERRQLRLSVEIDLEDLISTPQAAAG